MAGGIGVPVLMEGSGGDGMIVWEDGVSNCNARCIGLFILTVFVWNEKPIVLLGVIYNVGSSYQDRYFYRLYIHRGESLRVVLVSAYT